MNDDLKIKQKKAAPIQNKNLNGLYNNYFTPISGLNLENKSMFVNGMILLSTIIALTICVYVFFLAKRRRMRTNERSCSIPNSGNSHRA